MHRRESSMVVKRSGERHFTKRFDGGSFSHRVIVPGLDKSRVKVTDFTGPTGESFKDVSYPYDETVRVTRGWMTITVGDQMWDIPAGGTYYVPAGEVYSIHIFHEVDAICFFSQGADGTMPDDE